MSSVDDRIVNMQFNNKQFTQGAADSQKALEGLDRTIANTGKSGGLATMGTAVDGIKAKFSALQVAGVAALGTIVSKATSAGLSLLKSLTIDPVMQGFNEYTTNLNSIQTVMANTGASVDEVNGYMQKLNAYSDQTIYNFSEMAKNIGTFTAAGVDLKTATASIQGIANIAALSGSSSQQAATAMYQLSQAIAAGRVGLQDWNSVVNAGMGGKVFQTALANTAVAMGDISSSAIGLVGPMERLTVNGQSFRQSISAAGGAASWLSSDVLVNTLATMDGRFSKVQLAVNGYTGAAADAQIAQARLNLEQKLGVKYTDAQFKSLLKSADAAYEAATVVKTLPQLLGVVRESVGSIWSNSFSIILGDFEQSKKLWSAVGKAIVGPTGALTAMGTAWTGMLRSFVNPSEGGVEGGRTKILSGLARTFRNLGKIMGAVKDAYHDIFPPASAKSLTNIGKGFNRFSRYLILSRDTIDDLKTVFAGFFSILHIGFEILKGVGAFIGGIFKGIADNSGPAGSGLLSLVASFAELITKFDKFITQGGQIPEVMGAAGSAVGAFIGPVLQGIGLVIKAFASLVSGGGLGDLSSEFSKIQTIVEAFSSSTESGMTTLKGMFGDLSEPVDKLSSVLDTLKSKMAGFLDTGLSLDSVFSSIGTGVGALAGNGVELAGSIIAGLASGIAAAAPEILSAMGELGTSLIEAFKSVMGIHSPAETMVEPGINIVEGIIKGIIQGVSMLGNAIAAIGHFLRDAFVQLFGDMDALDFAALINSIISGGFLLALTNILNTVGGSGFFSGFTDIFDQLGNSLQAFQQALKADALLAIGTAVALLVASIVILGLLDPKDIAQGLGAIAVMMGLLVGSLSALSKDKIVGSGGAELIALGTAMNLIAGAMITLSAAIGILGNMDPETLGQGMAALALSLALMVGAARALSGITGSLVAAGASMVLIAGALSVLATAVLLFGSMDPDTLSQGMASMALSLALMVGALLTLGAIGPGVLQAGAAILIVAAAMQGMAIAIALFGNLDPETLSQGMVALALTLALMVAALLVLGSMAPAIIAAAGAMAIMAASMVVLATAVGIFGSMDVSTLAKGFIAIAIGLALLLAAAAVAEYVAPGLLALGLAVALLGAGVALAGAGMLMFATALTLLSVVGVAAIAIMVIAIQAFIALLPSIAVQVAAAFVSFIETMAKAAPRIHDAFSTIFKEMLGVITDAIPEIQKLLQALINAGITTIRTTVPQWIEMGMEIITRFLEGLGKKIPRIAEAALDMVEQFLTVIDNHLGNIIDKGVDIIVSLLNGLGKAAGRIAKQTGQTILDILDGIDKAVVLYTPQIRQKGLDIIGHLIDGMTDGLAGKITSAVGGAITSGLDNIGGAAGDIVHGRNPFGKKAAGNPFDLAATAINTALGLVRADLSEGDPTVAAAQNNSVQASAASEVARIKANQAQKDADDAAKKAAKKKGAAKAKAQKAANKAQKTADNLAAKAEAAENKASNQADALQSAIAFRDADFGGKGDIRSEQAADLAERASDLLAKANAEAAKARTMTGKAAKKMMAQAVADADAAKKLGEQAKAAQVEANSLYEAEVNARIKELEEGIAAAEKQKADDAAYEAADQAGKAKIMQDRAVASQAQADAAKAAAASLIAQAKALAATDAAGAMALLDQAEEQAALAQEAAERAEQERQQAEQLLSQPGTSSGGIGGNTIQPSRSVLEDAAKAVDRYSASLMEAQQAAAAGQTVVQYNQNVYAPTGLDAATVYRNSKNLVAAQGNSPGFQENPAPTGGPKPFN